MAAPSFWRPTLTGQQNASFTSVGVGTAAQSSQPFTVVGGGQQALAVTNTGAVVGNSSGTTSVGTLLASNVGIGVTAPAYALDVSGSARITGNVWFYGSNFTVYNQELFSSNVVINNYGTGPALSVTQLETTSQPLASFKAGAVQSLWLDPSGNVAIGKSTPGTQLDVSGNVRVVQKLGVGMLPTGTSANFTVQGTSTFVGAATFNNSVNLPAYSVGVGTTVLNYGFDASQTTVGAGGITVLGSMFNCGSTASPPTMLFTDSNSTIQSTNGYLQLMSYCGLSNMYQSNPSQAVFLTNNRQDAAIVWGAVGYSNAALQLGSLTKTGAAQNPAVTIVGDTQSLGIGQTNPAYKLDVSGTARVTSTLVANLFNSTSGSVTLTTSQTTLFTVTSGTSCLLVLAPTTTSLTKGLYWVEYTSGNDYCTVTTLASPAGGSVTLTLTAGSNYVNAAVNSGSWSFTWRAILI